VLGAVAAGDFFQFAQQFLLPVGQRHRRFDHDVTEQVAVGLRTDALDAFAAQAEDLAALRFVRDLELGRAVQCRDLDLAAERRGAEADRHFAVQVVVVALENRVCLEVDLHIQISRRAAVDAMLTLAGQSDAVAFIDPARNFYRQRFVLLDPAGAVARAAGVGDEASGAVAFRTGLLNREEALLQPDLTAAGAGRAGLGRGAGLGTGALAGLAGFHGRDANLGFGAERCLLKRNFEVVAQVGAAIDAGASAATATAAAEDLVEDAAEGVAKTAATATAHASLGINPGVAVLIVGGALVAIGEDLVGLFGFLEVLFRFGIVRIAVRVVFHGQLAVGLLDLVVAGVTIDAEDFVKVFFGCHDQLTLCSVFKDGRPSASERLRTPLGLVSGLPDYFLSLTSVNSASTTSP